MDVNITNEVRIKQHRGAGTVLLFVFFGWLVVFGWWPLLAVAWLLWMLIAGMATIFNRGFFSRTWYQPWPAWTFGIR